MPRPMWKGAVTFGLVSVPVSLYPATRRQADLSFRMMMQVRNKIVDAYQEIMRMQV